VLKGVLQYISAQHVNEPFFFVVFFFFTVVYTQLPFADNSLAGDIAVKVQRSGNSEAVLEPLFSRGIRLWKSDLGPIRPGALTAVSSSIHCFTPTYDLRNLSYSRYILRYTRRRRRL
jgi:hypothetical protein